MKKNNFFFKSKKNSHNRFLLELNTEYDDVIYNIIEESFKLDIYNSDDFIKCYENNGFLSTASPRIGWQIVVLVKNYEKVKNYESQIKKELERIRFENNYFEIITKIQWFCYFYEYVPEFDEYMIFGTSNWSFDNFEKDFQFEILKNFVNHNPIKKEFKVVFTCKVVWGDTGEIFYFDIKVYSPHGYIKELRNNDYYFEPHIIANTIDIKKFEEYIYRSITFIKVSTLDELKLKLGILSISVRDYKIQYKVVSKVNSNFVR